MGLQSLQNFTHGLKVKFSLPGTASPEDQLKPAVAELISLSGSEFGHLHLIILAEVPLS